MGFFDSVLEENTSTTTGTTSVTSQKTDEQDGSFLVIDDSMTTADIPDTAVKLFDEELVVEAPVMETIPASDKEISFFSETPTPTDEIAEVSEDKVAAEPEIVTEDAQEKIPEVSEVITEDYSHGDSSSTETYDIFAPVRKAIAEYNDYIAERTKIADIKDQEIIECNARIAKETAERNARIAAEKAAAKAALDERKKIEAEIDRAKQMQGVFTAQLEK